MTKNSVFQVKSEMEDDKKILKVTLKIRMKDGQN